MLGPIIFLQMILEALGYKRTELQWATVQIRTSAAVAERILRGENWINSVCYFSKTLSL